MTPAELVHAIRTAPNDDAALEVAEDFARHIVSVADASQAAAVAIARQGRAAEIVASLRLIAKRRGDDAIADTCLTIADEIEEGQY